MKILKRLLMLLIFAGIFAIAVIRFPPFQRAVAVRFLGKNHCAVMYFGKISIGLTTAKFEKLSFSLKNIDVSVDSMKIKWSLKSLLMARELRIDDLLANGVFVDIRSSRKSTGGQQNLSEFIKRIDYGDLWSKLAYLKNVISAKSEEPKEPLKIIVDHFKINGFLNVDELAMASVAIDGTGVARSSTADIDVKSNIEVGIGNPLKMFLDMTMKVSQTESGKFDTVNMTSNCKLFNDQGRVMSIIGADFRSTIGEDVNLYDFSMLERQRHDQICNGNIKFDKRTKKLYVECDGGIDSTLVGTLLEKDKVAEFNSVSKLNMELDLNKWSGLLKGTSASKFSASLLRKFSPSFLSDLLLSGELVMKMKDGILEADSMGIWCVDGENFMRIGCQLANPIAVWDKAFGSVAWKNIANSGKSLLKITIDNFNPKFDTFNSKYALPQLSSMRANFLASWQAEVVSKNGIFTLKSWGNRPLMLKKCTFVKNLKKYCDGVDISCSPTITFAEKVDVSFDDISVNLSDGSDVIAGSATISSSGARFDCNFVSKLDNLTKLPMMSQSPSIKSGICSGHVGCTRDGDSLSGSMELRVREFTLKDDATPVDGEGSVLFKRAPDDFQATIDLTLSGEHDTAMSLAVTADEDENTRKTDTKIELRGDSICVSDVINIARIPISVLVPGNALNALWRSQIAYAADVESDDMFFAGEKPRAVAAWSVISGSGVAEVKKIFLSKSLCLDNFECLCSVTDEKIDLKTVNFTVEESQFNLNSKMEFLSENTENQYAFSLYGSLEMANIGKLCRAIDPSGTALLDGEGKMSVQLASNGKNLWDTLKEVRGSVNANCSNGALCLTRLLGKKDRAVAEAIELAGVFLAQKSDKMASANALVNRLKHLEYDEIEISVKRNNSLDIVVDKFSISGPEIYITGNGRVSYVKYKHFKNYPLVLDFCTYAAGELGETMDSLGLIIDKPRNAQYMCGPHFTLGGTVGRINYSDFIRILCQFF